MAFEKALCAVLLLYSASFGESRLLENDPHSAKRASTSEVGTNEKAKAEPPQHMIERNNVLINAKELVQVIRQDTGTADQQLGYLYLQPNDGTTKISFTDKLVTETINQRKLQQVTAPWPDTYNTNFRYSFVNYEMPSNTNYGHAEYQLLTDNGLEKMVNAVGCPKYVILYSTNLPCYKPENPNPQIPRCAQMTLDANDALGESCADAQFYLYTDKETGNNLPDQNKMDFLMNSGITWLHKDIPELKPF